MEFIYIAGKYSADNIDDRDYYVSIADEVAREIFENGYIPVVPHRISYDWENDDRFRNFSNEDWLEKFCFPLLSMCDGLVVSCGLDESYGVKKEIEYARMNNIPVFYSLEEFFDKGY